MELPFIVGLVGSAILIIGAAWPVTKSSHPALLPKNQLFFVGSACMFAYSILNYFEGGSIFFVLLQVLIAITTILMMLNTRDSFDVPFITMAATALIVYSLYLSMGTETILFVVGLATLGIGFALTTGTLKRNAALGVGSAIIAVFSYLQVDWIFFGLNFFFAVFSFWHAWKLRRA